MIPLKSLCQGSVRHPILRTQTELKPRKALFLRTSKAASAAMLLEALLGRSGIAWGLGLGFWSLASVEAWGFGLQAAIHGLGHGRVWE